MVTTNSKNTGTHPSIVAGWVQASGGNRMHVLVLPEFFDYREHLTIWRKAAARDGLIPWELAREYFRHPTVWIDYRNPQQPVLMDHDPEDTTW